MQIVIGPVRREREAMLAILGPLPTGASKKPLMRATSKSDGGGLRHVDDLARSAI